MTESTDEFTPATATELARFVAENATRARRPLTPAGGRTALHYGYPQTDAGITIPLSRLTQVIDYPARDMTVTVEAGMRMDELQRLLMQERQRLPIDIATPQRATLGGAIATNTSGPWRYGQGTLRDYVIGISAIDATGRLFKAGGRVVKNVAGYDLCKLLIGSLGTLGIITQVTLKLRPVPEAVRSLWITFGSLAEMEPVLARLQTSAARPVAIELLEPRAASEIATESRLAVSTTETVLWIAVEGAARDAAWQIDQLKEEIAPFHPRQIVEISGSELTALQRSLTEYPSLSEAPLTFQANLLPSRLVEFVTLAAGQGIAVQAHAGNGIVIGHLPDTVLTVEEARTSLAPLQAAARAAGGHLTILHCDAAWKQTLPVFDDSVPAWPVMRHLKQQLDPHDLLNRGRMFR